MKDDVRRRIQSIMAGMRCPANFVCADSGFEHLCKARTIALERHLVCLEENPGACSFSVQLGDGHLCRCPLRVYLAKELNR